jgi:hypothetical protein
LEDRLFRMDFSAEELKSIPKPHAAFLISSCLAISDITIFHRLLLMALNGPNYKNLNVSDVIADYSLAQTLTIQRALAGKLKEYLYLCHQYQDWHKQSKTKTLGSFIERSTEFCKYLKSMPGYELVNWHRDNATHHYILKNLHDLLKLNIDGIYPIYLHKYTGNSLSFLGERVLLQKLNETPAKDVTQQLIEFQDWIIQATRRAQELHNEYCILIIEEFFPEKSTQEISIDIPPDAEIEPKETNLPFFWKSRKDE